jgi:hypothetical protein
VIESGVFRAYFDLRTERDVTAEPRENDGPLPDAADE